MSNKMQCECGQWSGVRCGATGATVTVEWMPAYLRESHRSAGNSGSWPHNGSVRIRVTPECAESMVEHDGEWVRIIGGGS